MSRVGARREREGTIPRATAVPRLAKPARHAGYAPRRASLDRRMPPQRGSRQPSAGWTGLAQRRRRGGRTSSVAPAFAGRVRGTTVAHRVSKKLGLLDAVGMQRRARRMRTDGPRSRERSDALAQKSALTIKRREERGER